MFFCFVLFCFCLFVCLCFFFWSKLDTNFPCNLFFILFFFIAIQSTVVGQVGGAGANAVSHVEQALKNVPEPVRVHLHVMAGTIALEIRGKNNSVTSSHALVRIVPIFFFVMHHLIKSIRCSFVRCFFCKKV